MVAVGSGKWKHTTTTSTVTVDDIIVTKRFHGSVSKLQELYHFERLIVSGAMHSTTLIPLLRECDSLGVHVHHLGSQGAYCLPEAE